MGKQSVVELLHEDAYFTRNCLGSGYHTLISRTLSSYDGSIKSSQHHFAQGYTTTFSSLRQVLFTNALRHAAVEFL
jgi:hypothetical protein